MIRWFLVTLLALLLINGLMPWLQKLGFGKLPGDFSFRLLGRQCSFHAYPVGCQSSFWVNPFAAVEHFVRGSLCVGNQSKN